MIFFPRLRLLFSFCYQFFFSLIPFFFFLLFLYHLVCSFLSVQFFMSFLFVFSCLLFNFSSLIPTPFSIFFFLSHFDTTTNMSRSGN